MLDQLGGTMIANAAGQPIEQPHRPIALMAWCEANAVDFLFGLARDVRLAAEITAELDAAEAAHRRRGTPARRFKDFTWRTRDSASRAKPESARKRIRTSGHMEMGMGGRVGNTITLNGRVQDRFPVRAGERVRLRLLKSPSRV